MGASDVGTMPEFLYYVVDVSDNSTEVYGSPGVVRGIYVNATITGGDFVLKDGSTTVFTIPENTPAGTPIPLFDTMFRTSIQADPDDDATGSVTVIYKAGE